MRRIWGAVVAAVICVSLMPAAYADNYTQIASDATHVLISGGGREAVSAPVYGRKVWHDMYKYTSTSTYNVYYYCAHKRTETGGYLIGEVMAAPDGKVTDMYFATAGHAQISGRATAQIFKPGQWNKLIMVQDLSTDKTDLYVNGRSVSEGYPSNYKAGSDSLRFVMTGAQGGEIYIDDVKFYISDTLPDFSDIESVCSDILCCAQASAYKASAVEKTDVPTAGKAPLWMYKYTSSSAEGMYTEIFHSRSASSGYLVYRIDVLPDEKVTGVRFGTEQHANMGKVFAKENMKAGEWNSIVFVQDLASDKSDGYLNGKTVFSGYDSNYKSANKSIRFIVDGSTGKTVYADNVRVYETDTYPVIFSDITGSTPSNIIRGSARAVNGQVYGKQNVNDMYEYTSTDTNSTNFNMYTSVVHSRTETAGYLVYEISFAPEDVFRHMYIATGGHAKVSGVLSAAHGIKVNKWNRIVLVQDMSTDISEIYVNGKLAIGDFRSNYTQGKSELRTVFESKSGEVVYADDVHIYVTDSKPVITQGYGLEDSEYFSTDNSQMTIVPGMGTTAADVISAVSGAVAEVWNGDYSVKRADADIPAEGDMLVINSGNETYTYYSVGKGAEPVYADIFSGNGITVYRAQRSAAQPGVFGKYDVGKTSLYTSEDTNSQNFYTQVSHAKTENYGYLVYELNIAPVDVFKSIYFATDGHAAMSGIISESNGITVNRWNRVVLVQDMKTDLTSVYVNGSNVSSGVRSNYTTGKTTLRLVVNAELGSRIYIGDIHIYTTAEPQGYDILPYRPADGFNGTAATDSSTQTVNIAPGTTAAEVCDGDVLYTLWRDGFTQRITDGSTGLKEGDIIVFYNGDVSDTGERYVYSYYTVISGIAVGGEADGDFIEGTVSVSAVSDGNALMAAAQYDRDGRLVNVTTHSGADKYLSFDYTPEELAGSIVKVFAFSEANALRPLYEPCELSYRQKLDILFVGNSFSMDVTWYLRSVAEADGRNYNVYVLNKGGSSAQWQYEHREAEPRGSDYTIAFWKNNSVINYRNLKSVLEDYDWDYVFIQNFSGNAAFNTFSETNYAQNWKWLELLAEYISEKEPEAKLGLHETWTYEAGYGYCNANGGDSYALRNSYRTSIKSLYEKAAENIEASTGKSVTVISSLDAFAAAEDYVTPDGLDIFNTLYSTQMHTVSTYTGENADPKFYNGNYLDVGDGSCLLTDEDSAAGRITLHRDGFHSSQAARYLIALNAYRIFSGANVSGNTFRPGIMAEGSACNGVSELLDPKSDPYTSIIEVFDPLEENVVNILQTIADKL